MDGATWKEFTDPSGRRFRLNLKTGATQWEPDQLQKKTATARGHAELAPVGHRNGPGATKAAQAAEAAPKPEAKPEAREAQAPATNWFAMHGWLDDWLGWGESAVDPVSKEVREDVAEDLGLRTQPASDAAKIAAPETVAPQSAETTSAATPTTKPITPRTKADHAGVPSQTVPPSSAEAVAQGKAAAAELYKQAAANLPETQAAASPKAVSSVTVPEKIVPEKIMPEKIVPPNIMHIEGRALAAVFHAELCIQAFNAQNSQMSN